jgi:eukaryotic-like serine/threonine-protein kinase
MTEPEDPLIGTQVSGRYRVLRQLGEGGMGRVYLAEHEAIEKKLALKVLRPEFSAKPDIVARFQQEAISASRIKHPNVLDVFDFGRLENGSFFLAMEFLEGNDLADELVRARVLEPLRGVKLALQICRALAAAHSRGVVHRDLKPENVFLQRTGDGEEIVKIVDFGIAQLRTNEEAAATEPKRRRLTRTGMIFGTPEYMAPEQAGGKNADLRVDVYAMGIIMYEMFTGAVPFTGDTFVGVLTRHLNDPPPHMVTVCPDLRISPELQTVIMKALSKDPLQRHASMNEFSQAILTTPEGAGFSRSQHSMLPEVTASQFMSPSAAHPTAAQFNSGQPHATAAQFGAGAGAPPAPQGSLPPRPGAVTPEEFGRAQTQLGAETHSPTPAPTKKSAWPLAAALAIVGVLGVGGTIAIVAAKARGGPSIQPSAELTAPPPSAVAAPPVSVAQPVLDSTAAPSASAAEGSGTVKLSVVTDPEGAVLMKNGFQVCDKTPCEVIASPNETLQLEARKGAQRGNAKVLAQRDQKVEIKLGAATGKPQPKPAEKPEAKPCLRERMQGDIKIVEVIPCPK